MKRIAIIGAGLTGLTAALRAAQHGLHVDLYESAPKAGGRTRSFFHQASQTWVDHGPHLLIGAYEHTQHLLSDIGATSSVTWQSSLCLPLWEQQRGHFALNTSPYIPCSLALLTAIIKMPDHGWYRIPEVLRLAISMRQTQQGSVASWMKKQNISKALQRDMFEILCLGAMNEGMNSAPAASFAKVLQRAFSTHQSARLGWFNQPLSTALIQPLLHQAESLGVNIHTSSAVQQLEHHSQACTIHTRHHTQRYDAVILATPPHIRNQLLNIQQTQYSQSISNIHLWFEEELSLTQPLIGGIGTYGQWFFDIRQQHQSSGLSHVCAIISADRSPLSQQEKSSQILRELSLITGKTKLHPIHSKVISVHHATHLVRPYPLLHLPQHVVDACEQPRLGELPATIETAIERGEQAAQQCVSNLENS